MFKCEFSTDNAAFEGDELTNEIERILSRIGDGMESGRRSGPIMDTNGNKIGAWSLTEG